MIGIGLIEFLMTLAYQINLPPPLCLRSVFTTVSLKQQNILGPRITRNIINSPSYLLSLRLLLESAHMPDGELSIIPFPNIPLHLLSGLSLELHCQCQVCHCHQCQDQDRFHSHKLRVLDLVSHHTSSITLLQVSCCHGLQSRDV